MNEAEVLAEVRRILADRRPADETIRAVRRLLNPPREPQPLERTESGWPVLRASDVPMATWEPHLDAEPS